MNARVGRSVVLAAGLVSLTWPMVIAHASLRCVFVRAYVADEATEIAYAVSVMSSALATGLSLRWPPREAMSWVLRCSVLGGLLGDIWLALGAYVHEHRSVTAFAGTLAGGLLYGAPAGFVVGLSLGAEMAAVHYWAERHVGPEKTWRFSTTVVLANAMAAVVLWCTMRAAGVAGDQSYPPHLRFG